MNISPIKTKRDYERALIRIEQLMDQSRAPRRETNWTYSLPSWRLTKPSIMP